MATINETIASFEAKRAATTAQMCDVMEKAASEGRTLDESEAQAYDTLKGEIKAIDAHIVRLKEQEQLMVSKAVAVTAQAAESAESASALRGGASPIIMRPNVEKGIAFTRYVKALAIARGNLGDALTFAQHQKDWLDNTPQVINVLKTAVAGGDTTTSGWASQLVYNQNLASEFIELLRPQTILGRIPGLTRVPFNVRMGSQTSGSTAYWSGQGIATPVSKAGFSEVTLGIAKATGLVVMTEELLRSSDPSAEMLMRNDLTETIARFLDIHFIAPDYAAVTNVSPASITNAITPTAATGVTAAFFKADMQTMFNTYLANNLDPTGCVIIMTPQQALSLSLMITSLGNPTFPNITMAGGSILGLPVITSTNCQMVGSPTTGEGQMIVLINAKEVLLADDGQVTIDLSREASIEMVDSSSQTAAGGTGASLVSMFQTASVALKATRFINWKLRRATAVAYIKDGNYTTS